MEQLKISVNFYRDTSVGSETQEAYWLELYINGENVSNEIFVEQDLIQLKIIIQTEEFSGYDELREWLKNNHPGFFEKLINRPDPDRIVGEVLKKLKDFYKVD